MSENVTEEKRETLKRISVSVNPDDYQHLKDLSRAGLSIGFLIREAIHDFVIKIINMNRSLYFLSRFSFHSFSN